MELYNNIVGKRFYSKNSLGYDSEKHRYNGGYIIVESPLIWAFGDLEAGEDKFGGQLVMLKNEKGEKYQTSLRGSGIEKQVLNWIIRKLYKKNKNNIKKLRKFRRLYGKDIKDKREDGETATKCR